MRRDDSVFFFTLVDFLVTALFFGLVLFAVGSNRTSQAAVAHRKLESSVDSIRHATGISDLTELTDHLTRLGPVVRAESAVQTVKAAGGLAEVKGLVQTVVDAGGTDSVTARLERLRQKEQGVGKPHCLPVESDPKQAIPFATVIATDSTMMFERNTPELRAILGKLGKRFEDVRVLKPEAFREAFEPILSLEPTCLHTLVLIERTKYVYARQALTGLFRLKFK
jgi:hypothetical protein